MIPTLSRRRFLGTAAAGSALTFVGLRRARAKTGGTLNFGLSSYPPTFEPLVSAGTAAGTVKLLLHRGLLSYNKKGELQGELAEDWAPDEHGVWTFHLRKNATWHDGRPVTSADVKWTIERGAAEDSTADYKSFLQQIERIEIPDAHTVHLHFVEPTSVAENVFAHYNMPMLPEGSDEEALIGAGPFKFASRERGVSIDLVAYEEYYKPDLPKLDGLHLVAYSDENLRVAALEAGDVDLIEYVPWQAMAAIEENPALVLDVTKGPFMYLTFNASRAPFDNPLVRQAVAHGIRRQDIVDAAFYGRGAPLAHLPISEASPFYNADLADAWAYDPEKAKRLLKEAGYPNGFECSLLSTAQYGMHTATAEISQAYLSMIGINAKLNLPDWATRVQLGNKGKYDLAVMGTTGDSNDPNGIARIIDPSVPASFVNSIGIDAPEISQLIDEGRSTFDREKRKKIYRKLEELSLKVAPIVGLCWREQGYGMKESVSGFKNLPGQLTFYSGITLEDTEFS